MLIMDQRTMQIKYRIPAAEIFKLSLSPYHDDIAVFHVRAVSSCCMNYIISIVKIYIIRVKVGIKLKISNVIWTKYRLKCNQAPYPQEILQIHLHSNFVDIG